MRESDIEEYLTTQVKKFCGEIRKAKWINRKGAPDRLVWLPAVDTHGPAGVIPAAQVWVELKAPGKKATFPADAHERAQYREHERMRRFGQRVEVVDSFYGVDEILRR